MNMSEIMKCMLNTLTCVAESCPCFHGASQQCMIGMWFSGQLGVSKIVLPPKEEVLNKETPVLEAIKSDNPFPELKPKSFLPSIAGRIATAIEIKEVETARGPVAIANFMLTDGAIEVRVAVWEPGAELNGFNVGGWITLTNMSVKDPYEGVTQISTTRKTKISR